MTELVYWLEDVNSGDVASVGGKNASLGEMISNLKELGINVPVGFATTSHAYWNFLEHNDLKERISSLIENQREGRKELSRAGRRIRSLFLESSFPKDLEDELKERYAKLSERSGEDHIDVAVRSSATAEDLPEASFAGQQETYLNVKGDEELMEAVRKCFASLFTDRAISYREENGFDHMKVALSVGVQKMVRSDLWGSGVMFTLDTETGFPDVVVINAAWGLGETVVQGSVNPDEYMVHKPLLKEGKKPIVQKEIGAKEKKMIYSEGGSRKTKTVDTSRKERRNHVLDNDEIIQLAKWGCSIEDHFDRPMDIEWGKDGRTGELYILQARPETVQSSRITSVFKTYELKDRSERLVEGVAIGEKISSGKVQIIESADDIEQFKEGNVLVTGMTDPDWVPIMKKAAAIVTDHGGRTSHAAIVSREFDITAVVGCGDATSTLENKKVVTVSCSEGDKGFVYSGKLEYSEEEMDVSDLPDTKARIMMNLSSPSSAYRWWKVPAQGIGLARMEFIINNMIKVHPMALIRFDKVKDRNDRRDIERLTSAYEDRKEYFVEKLAMGIGKMASSRYPDPVIVRMSDFKTNEYADLLGGNDFEFEEDNPMLGFRGAVRYNSEEYGPAFELEMEAVRRVREEMGFENVIMMIPFCRTLKEADGILELLHEKGLREGGMKIYVMAEIPSNVILAEEFSERFDGFSIGSNDLTQLVLGTDRDSERLSDVFDENDPAVKRMIELLIQRAHEKDRKVSFCGQAPSDDPDFASFLVDAGIDSISVNPDSLVQVIRSTADHDD
ncbi:MAG: phosphoenolpyruvate synthase [Thermoplasmatota archaeon]